MARQEFTLQELSARVERALSRDYSGQENGRVREVPDARTIRYYTTLGLVDRPAAFSGRTALYGRRHLLQLVAIKRLQARGLSLAGVQEELLGLSDSALARIARLPPDFDEAGLAQAEELPAGGSDRRSGAFWRTPTALAAAASPNIDAQEPSLGSASAVPSASPKPPAASPPLSAGGPPLVGIPVSGEVTLLVAAARPVEPADLEAVLVSLSPLLKVLEERRLIRRER